MRIFRPKPVGGLREKRCPNLQDNFGKKEVLTSRKSSEKEMSKPVGNLSKKGCPNQ
jgi:hypothetical protein